MVKLKIIKHTFSVSVSKGADHPWEGKPANLGRAAGLEHSYGTLMDF